ncbi:MAG: non-ribosomal peptide synthetase, partial [Burkholderiaceae bacterium]|nr:non-ribosomal peptide synthetase [Burkholderiaceae bacterium]
MTRTNPHDWPDDTGESDDTGGPAGAVAPAAQTGAGDGTAPLSWAQEALWFIDRLNGPNSVYNVAMSARLAGAPRFDLLERSVQALVERHESLRTAFDDGDGQPVQRIVHDARITLAVHSLETVPAAAREDALQLALQRQAGVPFDLARPPLMRAHLYRIAADDHVLLLVVHHIVADGWSRAVIARDLGALYTALLDGSDPGLPELRCRFVDVARGQRATTSTERLGAALDYWKTTLADLTALELPHDRPLPARREHQGDVVRFRLGPKQAEDLKSLARAAGATLYMALLAAWDVLLMRYSGQSDIAIGTAVAGRDRPGVEEMIGFFVNTLVMRTDLSGDPRFDELLARVRETCLGAYEHQKLPFDLLVRRLAPERAPGRNPLFQVSFTLQNTPQHALAIGSHPVTLEPVHTKTSKFDLSLSMTAHASGIDAELEFATDLFERETIERMAA